MLRDRLLDRLAEMGSAPDYALLAREVLGIAGASGALAERLVTQALVVGDRRERWRRVGEDLVAAAPPRPAVYVLRDADGRALYVGKSVNVKRRLRSHFSARRWRALKPALARVASAALVEVGSELEALVREAALIHELRPLANVQYALGTVAADPPPAVARDVIVLVPSIDPDSVELVAARADGRSSIRRARRDGSDLAAHARDLSRFFRRSSPSRRRAAGDDAWFAGLVFSWLAGRGSGATRLYPADAATGQELRARMAALLADASLFHERLDQRATL